jgi:DNA-damage-inducible protein J
MMVAKEGLSMAQAMVNFRMDENLKKNMEAACKDMGISVTTAFTIFATKVSRERRIPFEVAADPDPFYSEANMERLRRGVAALKAGKGVEHELIEDDGE